MTTQATRSSLLRRASRHDAQAWRELVDLYGPLASYWCRHSSLDSHAAADCVQDVFASVRQSRSRILRRLRQQLGDVL